uniref:Ovule protein n=1 Tax=Schistosoma mansoni TaxID=6183 RepID=A0A5K4F4D9_SCHMA
MDKFVAFQVHCICKVWHTCHANNAHLLELMLALIWHEDVAWIIISSFNSQTLYKDINIETSQHILFFVK